VYKPEKVSSSETSVNLVSFCRSTQPHIAENDHLHSHCRQCFKYRKGKTV